MMPTTHTHTAPQVGPDSGLMPSAQGRFMMSPTDHASNAQASLRILIPINANEDSRWGVRYAVQRHRHGDVVEVIFLNVGEPITQWQVLRFRTQQEIAQFQAERAQAFIEDASQALLPDDIAFRGIFKQGDVIFSILDTAEELACDEIAVPLATGGLPSLFSRGVVKELLRLKRDIPVVSVNSEGVPVNALTGQ